MIKKSWCLLFLILFLAACNNTGVKKRVISLDDAITRYTTSLRWSRLNLVEDFHLGKDGTRKKMDRTAMDKVRVTDYNILEQLLNDDASEALVRGEIDYYTTDTGTLKKLEFSHVWWYDKELKRWFNDSDYLDLK